MEELVRDFLKMNEIVVASIESDDFDLELGRKHGRAEYQILSNLPEVMEVTDRSLLIRLFPALGIGHLVEYLNTPDDVTVALFKEAFPQKVSYQLIIDALWIETLHQHKGDRAAWLPKWKKISAFLKRICSYSQIPDKKKQEKLLAITDDFISDLVFKVIRDKCRHSALSHVIPTLLRVIAEENAQERLDFFTDYVKDCGDIYLLQNMVSQILAHGHPDYQPLIECIRADLPSLVSPLFACRLLRASGAAVSWDSPPEIFIEVEDSSGQNRIKFSNKFFVVPGGVGQFKERFILNVITPEGKSHFVPHALERNVHQISIRSHIQPEEIKAYLEDIAGQAGFKPDWNTLWVSGKKREQDKVKAFILGQ